MRTDNKILRFLYNKKHDGKMHDVSLIFKKRENKYDIDMCVVQMEENGYVQKRVKGYLNERAIPLGDDKTDANNSICKITSNGINYYESFIRVRKANTLSIISLIIACLALVVTILRANIFK